MERLGWEEALGNDEAIDTANLPINLICAIRAD